MSISTAAPSLLFAAAMLLAPLPAAAQDESLAQHSEPPERISFLVTYGDDHCPVAEGEEIVVCAQRPESDRYLSLIHI